MAWDPAQYLKFADHRLRPAIELLNRIDMEAPAEVYDLGAGAGNATLLLKARWPLARITGVDASEAMLARAAAEAPEIVWQRADLATWRPPRPADVIYSNAALHWLADHDRLFPALFSALAPGGVLAVQMPRNFSAPPTPPSPKRSGADPGVRSSSHCSGWRRWPNQPSTSTYWRPGQRPSRSGRRSTSTCSKAMIRSRNGPRAPG